MGEISESHAKQEALNAYDYSRPLDVHNTSEHRHVKRVIQDVTKEIKNDLGKGYRQHPNKYKRHIDMVILDLFIAWNTDSDLFVAYSRDRNKYKKNSRNEKLNIRYNALISVIDELMMHGYVDGVKGFYDFEGNSRQARMKASDKLINLFIGHDIREQMISRLHPDPLLLRGEKNEFRWVKNWKVWLPGKPLEFEETRPVRDLMAKVNNINKLQDRHKVTFEAPSWVWKEIEETRDKRGRRKYRKPNTKQYHYTRIFNLDFNHGGRWYGHWTQSVPMRWRQFIRIDGQQVTELDFKAIHPTMLYAREGIEIPKDDLYALDNPPKDLDLGENLREANKRVLLTIFNVKPDQDLERAIATDLRYQKDIKLNHAEVRQLIEAMKEKHAPISHYFGSGIGSELQRIDSDIAQDVMLSLGQEGILALCVHDSFIVPEQHESRLAEVMIQACQRRCGYTPIVEKKY